MKHNLPEPTLVISNLVKYYDERLILDDVNLSVCPGAILALVGPNGAGKSTTLRCIVGELQKNNGIVTICDYDIDIDPVLAKQNVGYAADEPFLYSYLTGYEHVQLWGAIRNMTSEAIVTANILAEQLQIDLSAIVRTYSRGMRQKLALIGAVFHNPRLIILDEPFTAMDSTSTVMAITILQKMCVSGSSILFTSHQQDIVKELGATPVHIEKGKIR